MIESSAKPYRLPRGEILTVLFFAAISLALSYVTGKDLNWDFLNYHFYGAHLIVDGRLDRDYFAASLQSYLNPVVYVPQYLMIRAGWHSLLIAAMFTLLHAINLLLVWQIANKVLPGHVKAKRSLLFLAVSLAFVAPLYLTELGSSFADPITSIAILAGLLVLLPFKNRFSTRQLWWMGLWFGAATGLKLTNGAFLIIVTGFSVFLTWRRSGMGAAARSFGLLFVAASVGVLVFHGYWSYLLWAEFGNPLFPLFNQIFNSPDFPAVTFQDKRFLGAGWLGLLTLPFDMTSSASWVYSENIAVDIRPLALWGVMGCGLIVLLARRMARGTEKNEPVYPLVILTGFFFFAYLLWGVSSRIARYAYPLWLLVGPLLVAWLVFLFEERWARVLATVVLVVQVTMLFHVGNSRWGPTRWDAEWLSVSVPQQYKDHPYTFLTLGPQSYSAFVPFLHPGASVVNMVGQYNQPVGDRMTARMKRLIDRPASELKVVFRDKSGKLSFSGTVQPETREDVDAVLSVYGLRLSGVDCDAISFKYEALSGTVLEPIDAQREQYWPGDRLYACGVEKLAQPEQLKVRERLKEVDQVFDAVEKACGKKLSPHESQTIRGRNGWIRGYFNSLNSLATNEDSLYIKPNRSMVDFDLGPFLDWKNGKLNNYCPELPKTMAARG